MAEGSSKSSSDYIPPERWVKSWENGRIAFHYPNVSPFLKDHLDEFLNGNEMIKVFFPLCGKAVDMKWLYDMGHSIVGVDVARLALETFFKEHNMEYTCTECPRVKGHLLQSTDGRIKLYECDLYNFTSEEAGDFDAIFDRGSLVAINKSDRERYAALMVSLMAKGCRYIVVAFDYDESLMRGPPHPLPEYLLHDLFGDHCTVRQIDYRHATHGKWDQLKQMYEKAHLIIPKT